MIKVIGIIAVGLICIVVFKQIRPEYAFLLRLALTVPVIVFLISMLEGLFSEFSSFENTSEMYFTYFKIAVKVLGICYLSQTGTDICRDCGESALATQVELLGRIATVTVALPIIKELLNFSLELITK